MSEALADLKARHEGLEGRVGRLEDTMKANLNKIFNKLESLSESNNKRPSWATLTVITFLSSGFFLMMALLWRR